MTTRTPNLRLPVILSPTLRRNIPLLVVYGLLIILFLIGALNSRSFVSERNLFNILRQAAFLGTVAIGQTIVILSGRSTCPWDRWSS